MDYPNNFNIPAFPEARKIAFSRVVTIWYSIAFFIIISLAGLLFLTIESMRIAPYMIAIDEITGEWSVISETPRVRAAVPVNMAVQESVVFNFARLWFQITGDAETNEVNWCECNRVTCANTQATNGVGQCTLCCTADARLHNRFINDIVPLYRIRFQYGERRWIRPESVIISPVGRPNDAGGTWRVMATLSSNVSPARNLEIYVRIGRNENLFPTTLGYFVMDFNAFNTGVRP